MTVGGMKMLSSLGRTVFAVLRFAVGAGLALIGAGLLRHDPRVPAVLVHLATQPPFGGLWWALVSLAGGIALMLHAVPSPWRTDRLADRGAPEVAAEPEPAAPTQRSFDGSATPPRRWPPEAWEPVPTVSSELQPVAASPLSPPTASAPSEPASVRPVAPPRAQPTVEAGPAPVFRSRPEPRRPSRARMIGPVPS